MQGNTDVAYCEKRANQSPTGLYLSVPFCYPLSDEGYNGERAFIWTAGLILAEFLNHILLLMHALGQFSDILDFLSRTPKTEVVVSNLIYSFTTCCWTGQSHPVTAPMHYRTCLKGAVIQIIK